MASIPVTGLHHITAMAGHPVDNYRFYAQILGLRLVKKTVNFDAPDVYHLYYGDYHGSPGSIMTFFPFPNIRRGRRGYGQATVTAFAIPEGSLGYWTDRLKKHGVVSTTPAERMGEEFIYFEDPDGLGLELVVAHNDTRPGFQSPDIAQGMAIRGFHNATLVANNARPTLSVLTDLLNHRVVAEEGNRTRLTVDGTRGYIDVVHDASAQHGLGGGGTVHHIAFSTPGDADQLIVRENLLQAGMHVTEVLDRNYFHSIYFREPGGVLFEVATDPPGFAADEPVEALGSSLKLPAWYEPRRAELEAQLMPLEGTAV